MAIFQRAIIIFKRRFSGVHSLMHIQQSIPCKTTKTYQFINEMNSDCSLDCWYRQHRKLLVTAINQSPSPNRNIGCRSSVRTRQQTKTFFIFLNALKKHVNTLSHIYDKFGTQVMILVLTFLNVRQKGIYLRTFKAYGLQSLLSLHSTLAFKRLQ